MKNLSDVVDNEVFKNTKLNTLKTKVNNLEKKNSCSNYINLDDSKYITTGRTLMAETFAAWLKQADLVNKTDFDN